MDELKAVAVPATEELSRQLTKIDDDPHLVEQFYPRLLSLASKQLNGEGLVNALIQAAYDYTSSQPAIMATLMNMRIRRFITAFTDDPAVLADARAHLAAAGLPTD